MKISVCTVKSIENDDVETVEESEVFVDLGESEQANFKVLHPSTVESKARTIHSLSLSPSPTTPESTSVTIFPDPNAPITSGIDGNDNSFALVTGVTVGQEAVDSSVALATSVTCDDQVGHVGSSCLNSTSTVTCCWYRGTLNEYLRDRH